MIMSNSDCLIIFPKGQSRYSGSSPDRAVNYLERHNEDDLCFDMSGRPLAGVERQALVDYANDCGFRRMGSLSIRGGNKISDRDYRRYAREFFSEVAEDRPSLRVAYSVHRNTKYHHLQFVLTGDKEDCMTDKRELSKMRERGREIFKVHERERFREYRYKLSRYARKIEDFVSGLPKLEEKKMSRFDYLYRSILVQSNYDLNKAIRRVKELERKGLLDHNLSKELYNAYSPRERDFQIYSRVL